MCRTYHLQQECLKEGNIPGFHRFILLFRNPYDAIWSVVYQVMYNTHRNRLIDHPIQPFTGASTSASSKRATTRPSCGRTLTTTTLRTGRPNTRVRDL